MNSLLRRGKILLLLMLALALASPGVVAAQSQAPGGLADERPTVRPRADAPEAVPGRIIVKYEENTGAAAQAAVRRAEDLEKKQELGIINAEVVEVEGQPVREAIEDLEALPSVEYAEPDFKVYPSGYGDEPRFGELWGLHNIGQTINGSQGTADVDVNALEASSVTQGDQDLVIAVIDDGVDFSHPDLAKRAWVNPTEVPNNNADDDGNGKIDDINGWDFYYNDETIHDAGEDFHGTHVAGTIAASLDSQGVVGVAPNVKIMALKFLGPQGGTTSGAIQAIQYAKSMGAKISNNSWGGGPFSQALKDAIEASGSLFVAAAGNDSNNNDVNPSYPDSYDSPNILSVAAIDSKGNLASFSNYGAENVDISAPGVSILSSIPAVLDAPGATLTSVGSSGGKALTVGFGAEEIGAAADRTSFFTKAFTAVGHGSQPVVLVDDDLSSAGLPDVGPTLSNAIQSATGSAPQVIDVTSTDGPSLSQLSGKIVVWATGQAFTSGGSATTLTSTDQQTLTNFLNGGGKLVLTGMDALYFIEGSSFVENVLQLNAISDVPDRTAFNGTSGTAFAGESYDLNSSLANQRFHDVLKPRVAAAVAQGSYVSTPATWKYFNGTSMATPHATGAAALVASKYPDLLGKPTMLKTVIMESGKKLSATAGKTVTGDMVDARTALWPRVTSVSPAPKKTGVPRGTNVVAVFSDAMEATTINKETIKLVKSGTTTSVSANVSYNAAAKKATLDPSANLAPKTAYTVTVKGGSTGVKNTNGDPMFQSKVWKFKTGS